MSQTQRRNSSHLAVAAALVIVTGGLYGTHKIRQSQEAETKLEQMIDAGVDAHAAQMQQVGKSAVAALDQSLRAGTLTPDGRYIDLTKSDTIFIKFTGQTNGFAGEKPVSLVCGEGTFYHRYEDPVGNSAQGPLQSVTYEPNDDFISIKRCVLAPLSVIPGLTVRRRAPKAPGSA